MVLKTMVLSNNIFQVLGAAPYVLVALGLVFFYLFSLTGRRIVASTVLGLFITFSMIAFAANATGIKVYAASSFILSHEVVMYSFLVLAFAWFGNLLYGLDASLRFTNYDTTLLVLGLLGYLVAVVANSYVIVFGALMFIFLCVALVVQAKAKVTKLQVIGAVACTLFSAIALALGTVAFEKALFTYLDLPTIHTSLQFAVGVLILVGLVAWYGFISMLISGSVLRERHYELYVTMLLLMLGASVPLVWRTLFMLVPVFGQSAWNYFSVTVGASLFLLAGFNSVRLRNLNNLLGSAALGWIGLMLTTSGIPAAKGYVLIEVEAFIEILSAIGLLLISYIKYPYADRMSERQRRVVEVGVLGIAANISFAPPFAGFWAALLVIYGLGLDGIIWGSILTSAGACAFIASSLAQAMEALRFPLPTAKRSVRRMRGFWPLSFFSSVVIFSMIAFAGYLSPLIYFAYKGAQSIGITH